MNKLDNEFYKQGALYLENGNPIKALECFKQIEHLFSESAILLNDIGTAYGQIENIEKAISYYEKAILKDEKMGVAFYNLGIQYLEIENFNKAIDCFNKAIQNNCKEIWNCYYMRANTYYTFAATRHKEISLQALQDIEKAISLCPYDDTDIYLIAGIIYKMLDNFDKARFYLNKAVLLGDLDAKRILASIY
jgi:tetratricopeptide (TPR) repeat protein